MTDTINGDGRTTVLVSVPRKTTPLVVLNASDTVGIAGRPLTAHDTVLGIQIRENVSRGHKVALREIAPGEKILKYAQIIGYASQPIAAGDHVHTHNVEFRGTDHNYEFCVDAPDTDRLADADRATFQGYVREDGRVGTRNYVGVLPSVNCSATVARHIVDAITPDMLAQYPNVDGVVAFVHGSGCGMATEGEGFDNLKRVLEGHANHPNVAGALMVGLGCEANQIDGYDGQKGAKFRSMNIQSMGGHRKTVAAGVEAVMEMVEAADSARRETCSVSHLMLALQCGGSDAWSGITANPALGAAVDLFVRHGATAVLAETPEIYGAEHLLTRRASDPETAQKLVDRIMWWEDYVERNQGSMNNNPTPGNKQGGLTTILEKSLGAVAKGGTTRLNGVYHYAEPVDRKGFVFMDSPGFDPASITGEVAGGCNLVAFTTGRGSTYGCKPSPSIKIATNTEMYERMSEDMDVNAGKIITEGASVQDVGQEIFDYLLEVASGRRTLSELNGLGDNEFIPWHIGAMM